MTLHKVFTVILAIYYVLVNTSEGVTQEAQAPNDAKPKFQHHRSQNAQVSSFMVLNLHRRIHLVFVLGVLRLFRLAQTDC